MPKATLTWFGHKYQIITTLELHPCWHLIAHPNGPAVCNGDTISVIDIHPGDTEFQIDLKIAAQRAYREFTWPHIKPQFFPEDSE